MNSVATFFHFFPFLPFELRREIYILATPPRVVHVRESWDFVGEDVFWDCYDNSDHDYEDFKLEYAYHSFEDRYKANTLRVKIHPDIAYFARNWRDRIPRELRRPLQTCPESFGSTSNAASSGPWIPTEETPEIPLCWLEEDLCAAFELVRESHLYSQAPIPPLLHTWAESRHILMDYGYQLAFSTRTRGPRTWFHFARDRLYIIERITRYYPHLGLLSGKFDMAGQFNPKDLGRVKLLILGQRSYRPPYAAMIHNAAFQDCLSLFPNLEELFFEEWCGAGSGGQLQSTDNKPELDSYKETDDEKSIIGDARELWRCVPCEDMDGIAQVLSCAVGFGRRDLYRLDVAQYSYPRLFGYNGSWYEKNQKFLEGRYTQACRPYVKWNTVRVKFVHVFPETMARQFVRGRLAFWHYYMEFKRTYWKGKYVDSLGCVSEPPAFEHMRWWDSDQYRRWFVEEDRDMAYEPDPDGSAADEQYGHLAKYCVPKPRLGII